jgi:hypothetical protein
MTDRNDIKEALDQRAQHFPDLGTLFVLRNGVPSLGEFRLPKGVRQREPRMCFMNAFDLALKDPDRFLYHEGYAISDLGIPIHHAWVVDRNRPGFAIDPTWKKATRATATYFGVPIETKLLIEQTLKNEVYGILVPNEMFDADFMLAVDPEIVAVTKARHEESRRILDHVTKQLRSIPSPIREKEATP